MGQRLSHKDLVNYYFSNPDLIEKGFQSKFKEASILDARLDIVGLNKNETLCMVEIKERGKPTVAVGQIRRYLKSVRELARLIGVKKLKCRAIVITPEAKVKWRRPKLRRRPRRHAVSFHGGKIPTSMNEFFRRIFWKSELLAGEAHVFWKEIKKSEPAGMSISYWKEWIKKRNLSVGQFYNMIHGLVGAGLIEKRENMWHVSSNFLRELEQMVILYTVEGGYEHRLR